MNKDNFWYKNKDAGKCNENDIIIFEERYKIKLPEELRELYKIQNGGAIKYPYFREEISENSFKIILIIH